MIELADVVSKAVVNALKEADSVGISKPAPKKSEKTAFQKTEQLLFNYLGFKRIVAERQQEIADIRRYGVPQQCGTVGERVHSSRSVQGIVLPEESVEAAVRSVEASVQTTVQAIAMIDKGMATLKHDPYYEVLEMRYFEGRTLEDIGIYFGCDHTTISRNKNRLVKELSMRLFPDEVISEMLN
jgi:DNA-directed RNA polymerase specialized sigma subunit